MYEYIKNAFKIPHKYVNLPGAYTAHVLINKDKAKNFQSKLEFLYRCVIYINVINTTIRISDSMLILVCERTFHI